jgi:hypothetical protein
VCTKNGHQELKNEYTDQMIEVIRSIISLGMISETLECILAEKLMARGQVLKAFHHLKRAFVISERKQGDASIR